MFPRPEGEAEPILLDLLEQVQGKCPDHEAEQGLVQPGPKTDSPEEREEGQAIDVVRFNHSQINYLIKMNSQA